MSKPYEIALAAVIRGRKGQVIERALVRVDSENQLTLLKRIVKSRYPNLEIHDVNIRNATPPDKDRIVSKKYWCPYCVNYRKFISDGDGYSHCEICWISTRDFYVVKYNPQLHERVSIGEGGRKRKK